MKKIILVLCFLPMYTFGQKNTFGTNFGKTFFTNGDLVGNAFGLTYGYQLNKKMLFKVEYQRVQSQLQPEEINPGFISLKDQTSSSRILLGPSLEVLNARLGFNALLGYQKNRKFNNGATRFINDPASGGNVGYMGESGRYTINRNFVFKPSVHYKLYQSRHFFIAPEIGLVKSKINFDWLASININAKF